MPDENDILTMLAVEMYEWSSVVSNEDSEPDMLTYSSAKRVEWLARMYTTIVEEYTDVDISAYPRDLWD